VHEDRYFSDGRPTKLVRDEDAELYDPPPPGPPKAELVEVRHNDPPDGDGLRRTDDQLAGSAARQSAILTGPHASVKAWQDTSAALHNPGYGEQADLPCRWA
jgi:hypothetical protein